LHRLFLRKTSNRLFPSRTNASYANLSENDHPTASFVMSDKPYSPKAVALPSGEKMVVGKSSERKFLYYSKLSCPISRLRRTTMTLLPRDSMQNYWAGRSIE
jgi:hypothetical protein